MCDVIILSGVVTEKLMPSMYKCKMTNILTSHLQGSSTLRRGISSRCPIKEAFIRHGMFIGKQVFIG